MQRGAAVPVRQWSPVSTTRPGTFHLRTEIGVLDMLAAGATESGSVSAGEPSVG